MELYAFTKVCELYNKKAGTEIAENKLRDKLTEIVEAVGIDNELLKGGNSVKDVNGKTLKGSAYAIPRESVGFLAELIDMYTTKDFQLLRQAEFRDVSVKELQFLYNGFSRYLLGRGYSHEIINQQQLQMDRRLHYKIRLEEIAFKRVLNEAEELASNCEYDALNMNYDDALYFIRYMKYKLQIVNNELANVYYYYNDIRADEITESAVTECSDSTNEQRINKELLLADALEKDTEYITLRKQLEELIAAPGFVKKKEGTYKKICARLESITRKYSMELFGEILRSDADNTMIFRHPLSVLSEAIRYEAENIAEKEKAKLSKGKKEPEIDWKKYGIKHDEPHSQKEEDEIFLLDKMAAKIKGKLKFPCCNKEVIVYKGASGKCAVLCDSCNCYSMFDYDEMSATEVRELIGTSQKFKLG